MYYDITRRSYGYLSPLVHTRAALYVRPLNLLLDQSTHQVETVSVGLEVDVTIRNPRNGRRVSILVPIVRGSAPRAYFALRPDTSQQSAV